MKLANSLIKLSARNQEPRTKIPRKVLLRILVPGTWGEPRFSTKLFWESWFLADSLIKLLDGLIQESFVENLGSWYLRGTKILNKTCLGILVLGSWFLADSLIKLFES